MHLPRGSRHPPHCFGGLIHGEVARLARTKSTKQHFDKHMKMYMKQLLARGYTASEIREGFRRKKKPKPVSKSNNFYFVTTYSAKINTKRLKGILKQHSHILSKHLGNVNICAGFKCQRSHFRRMYRRNWHDNRTSGLEGYGTSSFFAKTSA